MHRLAVLSALAPLGYVPTTAPLPPLEPTQQPGKLHRQRRIDDIGCGGAQDVADRDRDDVADDRVVVLVGQAEWAGLAGGVKSAWCGQTTNSVE